MSSAHPTIRGLLMPFKALASLQGASGLALILSAALAALIANSPLDASWRALLNTPFTVALGSFELSKPILLWINDGLMGVFFFLVGLEIKREILAGELASLDRASLPLFAAIGGMVLPASIFLAFNHSQPHGNGWAIPMGTDIAFALGILAILGPRVPKGLKVFLAALAIVDDLASILVIAIFYTETISIWSLGLALLLFSVSALCNRLGVRSSLIYFALGTLVWLGFLKSGVHATLAGVLMAFTIPARTRIEVPVLVSESRRLLGELEALGPETAARLPSHEQQALSAELSELLETATAPLLNLEHALAPIVAWLIMPIFALANAGVRVDPGVAASLGEPLALGIALGLALGKPLGIFGFAWLAVQLGLARLPLGVRWPSLFATATLGGVGFTMSLFITGLAIAEPGASATAKLAILLGSSVSAITGLGLLLLTTSAVGSEPEEP